MKRLVISLVFLFPLINVFTQSLSRYERAIKKADSAYEFRWEMRVKYSDSNKLGHARKLYSAALAIDSGDSYPSDRIKEIDLTLNRFRVDLLNSVLIPRADSLLNDGVYTTARKYYSEAYSYDSTETYCTYKILLIDEILELKNTDSMKHFAKLVMDADKHERSFLASGALDGFDKAELTMAIEKFKEALAYKGSSSNIKLILAELETLQKEGYWFRDE
jgi:hypothetical protein